MPNAYNNSVSAADFNTFLSSEDGRLQRELLFKEIASFLSNPQAAILDAACGQGWLSAELHKTHGDISAFDSSEPLIAEAKKNNPTIDFQVADATRNLPYQPESFDVVILNMAAHDLSDLSGAYKNLHALLKPSGIFIMTIANSYYSYPVGVWKRGLTGFLLRQKPRLKVRPYNIFRRAANQQLHPWKQTMQAYFRPISEYINTALTAGFTLTSYQDLQAITDSPKFNVQYQLFRFPTILLMAFEKRSK